MDLSQEKNSHGATQKILWKGTYSGQTESETQPADLCKNEWKILGNKIMDESGTDTCTVAQQSNEKPRKRSLSEGGTDIYYPLINSTITCKEGKRPQSTQNQRINFTQKKISTIICPSRKKRKCMGEEINMTLRCLLAALKNLKLIMQMYKL